MKKDEVDKLFKKREELLDRLVIYNNPAMFNARNYEPHKKRIRKQLHEISNKLHKELGFDKRFGVFYFFLNTKF